MLVFTRTKHGANRLTRQLTEDGLGTVAIHGNRSQGAGTRVLADFKGGKVRALVATDIAARGLDIERLPHVVDYELPNVPEDYVHRIGRTARAAQDGHDIAGLRRRAAVSARYRVPGECEVEKEPCPATHRIRAYSPSRTVRRGTHPASVPAAGTRKDPRCRAIRAPLAHGAPAGSDARVRPRRPRNAHPCDGRRRFRRWAPGYRGPDIGAE